METSDMFLKIIVFPAENPFNCNVQDVRPQGREREYVRAFSGPRRGRGRPTRGSDSEALLTSLAVL